MCRFLDSFLRTIFVDKWGNITRIKLDIMFDRIICKPVFVCCRDYKYSDDVYHWVVDNGNYTDRKHSQYGNNGANDRVYGYYNCRFSASAILVDYSLLSEYGS